MAALATLLGLLLANARSAFLVTANVATNEILDSPVQVSSSAGCVASEGVRGCVCLDRECERECLGASGASS